MNQFSKILKFARPFWKTLLIIFFFILVLSVLDQVEPFINRFIVDSIASSLAKKKIIIPRNVLILFLILLITRFFRKLVRRAVDYFANLFTYRFRFSLREKGFSHLMSLSASFFDRSVSGELMSKLDRGTTQITQIVNNSGLYFVPSLLTAIIGIGVVSFFYWPIAVWMLLMYIPFTYISLWRFKRNQKLEKKEYKLYDTQYSHFWETITSIRLIKSFIAEAFELRRLKNFNQKILELRKTVERNWNIATFGDLLLEAWIWSIYVWVVVLTFRERFSLGTMILLINYIDIVRWPLWELNWFFWEAKRAQIGSRDYFKILDTKPNIKDPSQPIEIGDVKGRINFEKVSFSYKNEQVLNNLSLSIEPNTTTAFVGPSGSGKTTIVSLISRFYDVGKGKILVDGVDLRNVSQRELRKNIGWVTQEPYLFADTIEENLRYGKPKASQKELERAARIAHAHGFIAKLSKGYQTKIGERGVQLSGGQKQRIALARVILKNPPILILDEATSSLDSISEMYIKQALEKIIKGRTTIVIAHRLSTAKDADNIFVLKKGELIEEGNHEKLMKSDGLYASFFKIQTGKKTKLEDWDLLE